MDYMALYEKRTKMWNEMRKEMGRSTSFMELAESFYSLHRDVLPTDVYFTGMAPSEEEIRELESELGITIPKDYRRFLETFGVGGIFFEVFGYLDGEFTCLEPTIETREELKQRIEDGCEIEFDPDKLLIVSYDEMCAYGIDTDTGRFIRISDDEAEYLNIEFGEYLLSEMECTIEEAYMQMED